LFIILFSFITIQFKYT